MIDIQHTTDNSLDNIEKLTSGKKGDDDSIGKYYNFLFFTIFKHFLF